MMAEQDDTKTVVAAFVKRVLEDGTTQKDPAMVAAIAELIKEFWLL